MKRFLECITALASDDAFTRFQNNVTRELYHALGAGYSNNDDETNLVTRLVNAINGKSYGPLRIHATMLHGGRSHVKFRHMDSAVTTEVGDMAVVTLVTNAKDRLIQRICIVQNKKKTQKRWDIDLEQLYLLKNFPSFTGTRGIFRNRQDVVFRNVSGCLGAFGLFHSPGELTLVSAPLVTELLRGKKSLSASDLSLMPSSCAAPWYAGPVPFAVWPVLGRAYPEEWSLIVKELAHYYSFPLGFAGLAAGFLGNVHFSRDLYDFMRNWTQLNIGETSFWYERVLNAGVDAFSNFVIRCAGFSDLADFPPDSQSGDQNFERGPAVLLLHVDASRAG